MKTMKEKRPDFDEFKNLVPAPYGETKLNYLVVMPGAHANTGQFQDFAYFVQGTAYISAALKASGRNVFTLNLLKKTGKDFFEVIKHAVTENNIDVLLIGGTSLIYKSIKDTIDAAKSVKPGIIVIAGGGLISSAPEAAMKALENADYGVVGEGEVTVCELAYAIEKSILDGAVTFSDVNGIIYYEQGWKETKRREEIANLDIVPWPDYESFDYESYLYEFRAIVKNKPVRRKRGGTVIYGRSCPFNCTFCFHPSGSKYRQRSLDSFFAELDYLITNYALDYLLINDELLFSNSKLAKAFCERIKKYEIVWVCSLRVDIVTKEFAEMLLDSGCVFFAFGLESADDRILKSMRKHITVSQIENALDICHEIGANGQGYFIFGDLEETIETAMNTINFVRAHPQYSHIGIGWIKVFPGSHLFNVAVERGIIKAPVEFIKSGCPLINVSKLSDNEYKAVQGQMLMLGSMQMKHAKIGEAVLSKSEQEGCIDIEGLCEYCGTRSIWYGLDAFRPAKEEQCIHCGAMLIIHASDYARSDVLEENIKAICANKIALWAIVDKCEKIFKLAPSLLKDNVFLVDSAPSKHGIPILDKKIEPPSIIDQESIDTVIITIGTAKIKEIKCMITRDFPNVKNVLCIGDLLI